MADKKESIKLSQIPNEPRDIQKIVDHKNQSNAGLYIQWGPKNDYPDYLNGLYMESALMNSIVDSIVDYICGEGLEFNPKMRMALNGNTLPQLKKMFRHIAFDKVLFGGFAIKLIYNRAKEIAEIEWIDARNVRIGTDEKTVYYSENWGKGRRGDFEVYTLWDQFTPGADANNPYECIYFFNGNSRYIYPLPSYVGSLRSIETAIEIDKFHFSSIQNNLNANTIININDADNYSEEEKAAVERKIRQNFCGSQNGSQFLLAFNTNKDNAVTIERLSDDQYDKKYEALAKNTRTNIFVGFRVPPIIAGFPPENGGFSKTEYVEAFELFNTTVIAPQQHQIINVFNELFDLTESVVIKPFEIENEAQQ